MPPPLPPPPSAPDLFDLPQSKTQATGPPILKTACEGIELTVFGLPHTSPSSAAQRLQELLRELQDVVQPNEDELNVFRALRVHQADFRASLDYAYVYLDHALVPSPRADLLQYLRRKFRDHFPNFPVQWRTMSGQDKTRRLTFAFDNQTQAREVAGKLGKLLKTNTTPS